VDAIEGGFGGAIQIANNGKMYVNISSSLCEIVDPENLGSACNYKGLTVLSGTQYFNVNLPTFLQSYFQHPVIATGNCHFQNINFSVQNLSGVNNILWDFDDPASGVNNRSSSFTPTHIFSQEGYYLVKAILYNANGCGADTIRKQVYAGEFKVFLGNDTTICEGDSLKLTMKIPNAGNQWSNNGKDTAITVTKAGKYWVKVSLGECSASDTINIAIRPLPAFTLGKDTTICSRQTCTLSSNPSPANASYLWNTGATTPSITAFNAGMYWLKVKEVGFGCKYADSINVSFKSLPNYNLGSDTSLCENERLTLNAGVSGATSYLWNTGDTTSFINAYQTNIYWADVTKDNCVYRDSISVLFKPMPIINLGRDTTLCEGQTVLLDAQNMGSQYLWQDNSNSQTKLITRKGNYWVKVTNNGCSSSDSIFVNYNLKPVFTLGSDTVICNGQTITLQPKIQNNSGVSWLWTNGRTNPTFAVTQTGEYVLQASNFCGSRYDTIKVSKGVCKLYVPSAFTPNNDGLNDVFRASYGENIIQFSLDVYNRWGQKVFYSTDINKGWDGKINGTIQASGAYVWMIKYKVLNDAKEYLLKGTVMLIR
jgi:gliding motility-associated-like protein